MAKPSGSGGSGARPEVVRVLVVQDHPLLGSAIASIFTGEPDITVCGVARSGADAARVALRDRATVVLIDFHLPDMSGPAAAAAIREDVPGVAVVFHSAEDSEAALLDAIDAGATAYLTKSASAKQIVEAVRKAASGDLLIPAGLLAKAIAGQQSSSAKRHDRERLMAQFTDRELNILAMLAEGLDTITMSRRLGVAVHTIEWHVKHVIEKLGVHSKLQAVITAARLGIISLNQP